MLYQFGAVQTYSRLPALYTLTPVSEFGAGSRPLPRRERRFPDGMTVGVQYGRPRAVVRNSIYGDAWRHTSANSSRKSGATASPSSNSTDAMWSLRLRSSMYWWSGSKPFGGRLSDSPPIEYSVRKSGSFAARSHLPGFDAMAFRILASDDESGCQMPTPAKTSPGARCR